MKLTALKGLAKGAKILLVRNAPGILTGIAASGTVLATLSAVRDSFKAKEFLDNTDAEGKELIKPLVLCYLPTIGLCAATVSCVIFANATSARRNAALATAYTLSEATLKDFQETAKEVVGEEKVEKIREKSSVERIQKTNLNDSIIETGRGNELVIEPLTGQIMRSSREEVERVRNFLNDEMNQTRGFISFNEWLSVLGYRTILDGDEKGWSYEHDGLIDVSLFNWEDYNGQPARIIDYINRPSLYANGLHMI